MKTKIYITNIFILTFLFFSCFSYAQWNQKAEIPTARSFLSSCLLDGKIYVIGGTQSTSYSGEGTGIMEVYYPVWDIWDTNVSEMPTNRVEFSTAVINGKIYAIGGATSHGGTVLGTVEEYDPVSNTWSTKTPMPTPRSAAASCVIDNKIYVAGGYLNSDFAPSNVLEIYDPVSDTWNSDINPMYYHRFGNAGCVINGEFYSIGGLYGSPWNGESAVQKYDPVTNNWYIMASLKDGRVGHSSNSVLGKIYTIGGEAGFVPVLSVEEYNPVLNVWTAVCLIPAAMIVHTACVFENKIFVFSGSSTPISPNLTPMKTVYSFDPTLVDIESENIFPEYFKLYQAYPNPFNPTTKIEYSIPEISFVTLKVYDVLGNEIETLVNEEKLKGNYEISFNGNGLTNGVYFYQLKSGDFSDTKKMILLK